MAYTYYKTTCAICGNDNTSFPLVVTLYVRSASAVPHHWNNFRLSSLKFLGI